MSEEVVIALLALGAILPLAISIAAQMVHKEFGGRGPLILIAKLILGMLWLLALAFFVGFGVAAGHKLPHGSETGWYWLIGGLLTYKSASVLLHSLNDA